MSQCVSVLLSWADDSSWAGWSPGCGHHRDGNDVQTNNVGKKCSLQGNNTDNSWVIFPVLPIDFLFSLHFALLFCSFSAAKDQQRSAAAMLPYYAISVSWQQSSLNFNYNQKVCINPSSEEIILASLKTSDVAPVTHLKLLLFAGGSFSQALCRACSLLSWSWMLQNGTQKHTKSKHKDVWNPKNQRSSWVGTHLEAWIQSLYSSYVISGSGSSRRYDFSAPEAEGRRGKCLNAHLL